MGSLGVEVLYCALTGCAAEGDVYGLQVALTTHEWFSDEWAAVELQRLTLISRGGIAGQNDIGHEVWN